MPECFEACTQFVSVDDDKEDVLQASGPASATTAAAAEVDGDMAQFVKWLSVVNESNDDTMEATSLPALQHLLERMESQAGRVVANEVMTLSECGAGRLDDLGRARLGQICRDFHEQCAKVSRSREADELLWRVQAIENGGVAAQKDMHCNTRALSLIHI